MSREDWHSTPTRFLWRHIHSTPALRSIHVNWIHWLPSELDELNQLCCNQGIASFTIDLSQLDITQLCIYREHCQGRENASWQPDHLPDWPRPKVLMLCHWLYRRNWRMRCCPWKRSCSCTRRRKCSAKKWQNTSRYCHFHQCIMSPWPYQRVVCGGNDYPSIMSLCRTKRNIPRHRSKRNLKPFTVSWRSRRLPDFLL